ncbi:WD40-repeat-containing domain protein [Rhodotorula diobovata]|uniref:Peroxin-7 n=1 Tax=Rhodotorula diobovata TaxID=5288 RepID=A0A5C5FLH7_9BASI|nr:WD40-repeat-containing domain protein [Rhodotorula diobovata]
MALPAQPPFKRLRTDGFANYSVAFSPFYPGKLALAGAANFGLVGNGRLSIVTQDAPAPCGLALEKGFDTQDGLYDLAWSECHENQIATGSGDGSVKLWDVMVNDFPVRKWHEHQREVFSVDWSNVQKELFCTSSWDGTIKIWTPDRPASLQTIPAHGACVYAALFSPSQPSIIASCSSDGSLKLWDTRSPLPPSTPAAPGQPALATPQLALPVHPGSEVLDLDFNKYANHLVATASVDRSVKVSDLRAAATPAPPGGAAAGVGAGPMFQPNATVATLLGHEYAVRRVAWCPHSSALVATASYDMTARVWSVPGAAAGAGPRPGAATTFSAQGGMGARIERVWDRHTEFVVGAAWSLWEEGVVASCSWDQEVHLWR